MERDAEAVADAPFRPQVNRAVSEKVAEHGKERMLADSPRGRISVKEKLAEMREKAYAVRHHVNQTFPVAGKHGLHAGDSFLENLAHLRPAFFLKSADGEPPEKD